MGAFGERGRRFVANRAVAAVAAALISLFLAFGLAGCGVSADSLSKEAVGSWVESPQVQADQVPEYSGSPSVELNGGEPYFDVSLYSARSFEAYSRLDSEGRCGPAMAMIGTDIMPTEERGPIGEVKPTGWHLAKYDWVDGKYLYNRCHLIGYQLSGENANERNLITGTRYMNVQGMQPYEDQVADYVKDTGNHVLYRVTPVFEGDDQLARGVVMEAESVEDGGAGVRFCVFCYDVQPGVSIDYATGDNESDGTVEAAEKAAAEKAAAEKKAAEEKAAAEKKAAEEKAAEEKAAEEAAAAAAAAAAAQEESATASDDQEEESSLSAQSSSDRGEPRYILNTNSKKFHYPDCSSVDKMSERNKQEFYGTRDEAIAGGYSPCGRCNP